LAHVRRVSDNDAIAAPPACRRGRAAAREIVKIIAADLPWFQRLEVRFGCAVMPMGVGLRARPEILGRIGRSAASVLAAVTTQKGR